MPYAEAIAAGSASINQCPPGGEAGIQQLQAMLQGSLPIIGVGGIMCAADVKEKIAVGASLVQIYTGLIYRGPDLVRESAQAVCTP